jgi:hypothetical protein
MANLATISPIHVSHGKIVPAYVLAEKRKQRAERQRLLANTIIGRALDEEASAS